MVGPKLPTATAQWFSIKCMNHFSSDQPLGRGGIMRGADDPFGHHDDEAATCSGGGSRGVSCSGGGISSPGGGCDGSLGVFAILAFVYARTMSRNGFS